MNIVVNFLKSIFIFVALFIFCVININESVNALAQCHPKYYLCYVGTAVVGSPHCTSDTCYWQCISGSSVVGCIQKLARDGVCSTTEANKCLVGTAGRFGWDLEKYYWTCQGVNGGKDTACNTFIPVNGECGSSLYSCNKGAIVKGQNIEGKNVWNCNGLYGGGNANCSKEIPVNGVCSLNRNNCTNGNPIDIKEGDTNYTWTCQGLYGGSNINCVENKKIDGVCGNTHFMCSIGTSTNPQSEISKYSWNCEGINGGITQKCIENRIVNAECSNKHFNCKIGQSVKSFEDDLMYSWTCNGINGGTNIDCIESKPPKESGVCGSLKNSCLKGNIGGNLSESLSSYSWECLGVNGGENISCSLTKSQKTNGVCGSKKNTCMNGEVMGVVENSSKIIWECKGTNGGESSSCSVVLTDSSIKTITNMKDNSQENESNFSFSSQLSSTDQTVSTADGNLLGYDYSIFEIGSSTTSIQDLTKFTGSLLMNENGSNNVLSNYINYKNIGFGIGVLFGVYLAINLIVIILKRLVKRKLEYASEEIILGKVFLEHYASKRFLYS